MAYPFDESPFEDYFPKLRHLRLEELEAYIYLTDEELPNEDRPRWIEKLSGTKENIKALIARYQIPPRSKDIYLGEIELALEKLEREFPKPEKPLKCEHPKEKIKLKYHADDTSHVVSQCCICGQRTKNHKKLDFPNWNNLPLFEYGKGRKEDAEFSRWWKLRNEVLRKTIGEDGRYPVFDYEEFQLLYESHNPKSLSPNECKHEETQLTQRSYSENNIQIVRQCNSCGKHVENIAKKNVKNANLLPAFNMGLEDQIWDIANKWSQEFSINLKHAKASFNDELLKKIESGEVSRVSKDTYGTYYDSDEWSSARKRALSRDKYICQACEVGAECVHHLTYDRLGKENELDLISLCNSCHKAVHKQQDNEWPGYRLTPIEIRELIPNKN